MISFPRKIGGLMGIVGIMGKTLKVITKMWMNRIPRSPLGPYSIYIFSPNYTEFLLKLGSAVRL
jgi:hypothetical protein